MSGIVPLMTLLASHDADVSANDVTWLKSDFSSHFNCLYIMDAVVPLRVPLVSHDASTDVCAF